MKTFRPLRTISATITLVAALIILGFAAQDLWGYYRALAQGWTAWAVSAQGLWQLSNGLGELLATALLLILFGRLLGTKFARSVPTA